MASLFCRRLNPKLIFLLQNPKNSSFHSLRTLPIPKPSIPINPNPLRPQPLFLLTKHFSTQNPPQDQNPNPNEPQHFQHQEIEGPTVERDVSALANETRQALETLRKSIYKLSSGLAVLGVTHLGLGATIAYTKSEPLWSQITIQGLAAFAFPFSVAFLLRRSLKPMTFFQRMEELGRLQILTLSLQVTKTLNVLFIRIGTVSIFCAIGISGGALLTLFFRIATVNSNMIVQNQKNDQILLALEHLKIASTNCVDGGDG